MRARQTRILFDLDFGTLENPDVLENFDFDSFLVTAHEVDSEFSGPGVLKSNSDLNDRNTTVNDIGLAMEQEVHSTISQDFSQGRLARETASLQTLGRKSTNAQDSK